MTLAHRPRGVPELIDAAFQLMRRHYVPLLVLAAITYIPSMIFFIVLTLPAVLSQDEAGVTFFGLALLLMPVMILWYSIGLGALLVAASEAYQGRPVDPSASLRASVKRMWPIIGAQLLKWIVIGVAAGILALVTTIVTAAAGPLGALVFLPLMALPIIVAVRLFAIPAIPVLEGLGAGASLSRSGQLSRGHGWMIFWTYFVVYAIIVVLVVAATIPGMMIFSNPIIANILSNVLSIFAFPLLGTTGVVLYYDLRIRKEGFDLELMQRQLADAPAGQPV